MFQRGVGFSHGSEHMPAYLGAHDYINLVSISLLIEPVPIATPRHKQDPIRSAFPVSASPSSGRLPDPGIDTRDTVLGCLSCFRPRIPWTNGALGAVQNLHGRTTPKVCCSCFELQPDMTGAPMSRPAVPLQSCYLQYPKALPKSSRGVSFWTLDNDVGWRPRSNTISLISQARALSISLRPLSR